MLKLTGRAEWLAVLVTVTIAVLVIGGCPQPEPPPEPPPPQEPANRPPVIDSLSCQWQRVKTNMTVPISCDAHDPDGDELSYVWSVTGGEITGQGPVGEWITPVTYGSHTVNVTVSDGRGGHDFQSLDIGVACCLKEAAN